MKVQTAGGHLVDRSEIKAHQGPVVAHWVANTHWDREWQYSFQRSRYMLVELMDTLLEILERRPDFHSFHLDSQSVPIEDYLEMRPERRDDIKRWVKAKRLVVGPWYTLPDESSVSGESLIRNLLLGHRIADELGHVPKVGYSPFGWGQIAQMPQIYRGFGIDSVAFYRGVNSDVAPRSEFYWEGPDGSRVLASRLGTRMRFNAWFNLQRAVFFNWPDVDNKTSRWRRGGAPIRFVDPAKADTFYTHAHPEYKYYRERIAAQVDRMIRDQDEDWTTPHRFWANGHDLSGMDIREPDIVRDANAAMDKRGEVRFSTYEDFQQAVKEAVGPDLPLARGEMRHTPKKGDQFGYMGHHNITSACVDLKIDQARAERALIQHAEPATVLASLLGVPYPRAFVDEAYRLLLQNHGHDTIGGCARGVVHRDMRCRLRQVRELARGLLENALTRIAGAVDCSDIPVDGMALIVYNPAGFTRTVAQELVLDIPKEWECDHFTIRDEKGTDVPLARLEKLNFQHPILHHPTDVQVALEMDRYRARVAFPELPALGYRTFKVEPALEPETTAPGLRIGTENAMENAHLKVEINHNGTLRLTDKTNQRVFDQVGYFQDRSAIGDAHHNTPAPHDTVYDTLNESARITCVEDNDIQTTFEIRLDWALPEDVTPDRTRRSTTLKTYPIATRVTLTRHHRYVTCETTVDNQVKNHYLTLCYPTHIETDHVHAQTPFDIATRAIPLPDPADYAEPPTAEQPMKQFVDLHDDHSGLAFLSDGIAGYEAIDDEARTMRIALLRSFTAQMGWWTPIAYPDEETQALGRQTYRYAFYPHGGNTQEGRVWRAAEDFVLQTHPMQIGGHDKGTEPRVKSLLECTADELELVALKQSEDGTGWVLRLFNPTNSKLSTRVRLNQGKIAAPPISSQVDFAASEYTLPGTASTSWSRVEKVSLEEKLEETLSLDEAGWLDCIVAGKQLLTLKFIS